MLYHKSSRTVLHRFWNCSRTVLELYMRQNILEVLSPLACDVTDVVVVVVIDELEDDKIVLTTTFIAQLMRGSAVIKQGIFM